MPEAFTRVRERVARRGLEVTALVSVDHPGTSGGTQVEEVSALGVLPPPRPLRESIHRTSGTDTATGFETTHGRLPLSSD